MAPIELPLVVRNKAIATGAVWWIDALPEIVAGLDPKGRLVLPYGDPDLDRALEDFFGERRTFGSNRRADLHPTTVAVTGRGTTFTLGDGTRVSLRLLGAHNVRNALAALAAAAEEGFSFDAPPLALCTDNAAMIGVAAEQRFLAGCHSPIDLAVAPRLNPRRYHNQKRRQHLKPPKHPSQPRRQSQPRRHKPPRRCR